MNFQKKITKTIILTIALIILSVSIAFAEMTQETKFIRRETDFETPVYIFKTSIETPVVLIIAGTHGNEPAGITATKILKNNLKISKGTLLIIPNANILACKKEMRSYPNGINLNRVYPGNEKGNEVEKIAFEIFNIMKKYHVDFLLDLHESREFYKINSQNYGQTIVLDCCDNNMLQMCSSIADQINEEIDDQQEKFEVLVKPIKGCATYAASCQLNIPAFTFETCKKLSLEKRVETQIRLVQIVLSGLGIIEIDTSE